MDTVRKMKLKNLREKIVQDVDVEDILDYLISKDVLTEDEIQLIKAEKTRKDQTRHLLDILPRKNIQAFEHFVEALRVPYEWLSTQLQSDGPQTYQVEEKSYFDSLLLGGLPQSPPPNYVERKEKVEEVRQCLRLLKRGQYVVLHGMTGCGKSCLAAAALDNKQLLIETFNGVVYWMSVGDANSDDLLCHLTELMEKLSHHPAIEPEKKVQSSTSVKGARESLRWYFTSECLRYGLLILDDVSSPDLIDAFDIGCKILVTTKDSEVMKSVEGRQQLIKISEGFTEQESLSLIATCVGVEIPQLPPQAKKIHKLCKGVPMIIALIGAQLAENQHDVRRNMGRWDYYLDKLTKRDYRNIKRSSFSQENGMFGAIRLCIENLPETLKHYYQDFALFVEDVNITPEVLGTLWSLNKYEVEDIMTEFLKKSLAASRWNELHNSYVYGIHDLLLSYLKLQLSDEEKKALHKKLLDCYRSVSEDFSNLPNDNYIYSYIGYHLSEAEMWSVFPKLFLNLEFIGSKLKVTGPGDLLVDYKKYSNYITGGDEKLRKVLEDYEQFIQAHGLDLHKYQDMDIVQCGLQESKNSHIYKEALRVAKERPKKLYLEFLLDKDDISQPQTMSVKEEVFAACFTTNENKLLVANGNGVINLWDTEFARILYTFSGHKQRVLHLKLSPNGTQFMSCSEDGCVKLWNLEGATCKNKDQEEFDEHGCALKTPSPRMRQDNWSNMFSSDTGSDRSHKTFSEHGADVLYASFSHDGQEIISCSKDGSVKVWERETGITRLTFNVPSAGSFANCCIFSEDNALIFFGGDDKVVYVFDNSDGGHVSSFETSGCVIAILSTAENEVAVVTDNSLTVWSWECEARTQSIINAQVLVNKGSINPNTVTGVTQVAVSEKTPYSMNNIISCELNRIVNAAYTCATLSQDGQYVVVGASNFSIGVWDIDKHKLVMEYQDHTGWVRCLDTFWGTSYHLLLSGSDDRTIKIWHMEPNEVEQVTKLKQNFDALWDEKSSDPSIPLLVAPDNYNKLQLLRGRSIVTETVPEEVEVISCKLSGCGQFLVYGCQNGNVKLFNIKQKLTSVIIKLNGAVQYLQVGGSNGLTVVAAGEDSSLKVWKEKVNESGIVITCAGQTDKVVQCFFISLGQKLLSCAQDGSVKIWEVSTGKLIDVVVGRHTQANVTMSDLSTREDLLVLCDASGNFLLVHMTLSAVPPYMKNAESESYNLSDLLRSCKLSHDAHLLALGQDNGKIILWDVINKNIMATLELHKTWVQNLLFSPFTLNNLSASQISQSPVILVSVADQIGWWDVSRLCAMTYNQRRRMSSGQRRKRKSGDSPKPLPKLLSLNGSAGNEPVADEWLGKEGPKGKPELLGCVKLVGREAKKVSASKDFSAFATIDASGIVYLMKILR